MASADTKAFIVTGSSTGVGAATALQLARRGASVVINYSKSAAEAEETAQACNRLHPRLTSRAAWASHNGPLPIIEGTVIRLRRLLERYRGVGYDEEALWLLGRAYVAVAMPDRACGVWSELVDKYPKGSRAGDAKSALSNLHAEATPAKPAKPDAAPAAPPAASPAPGSQAPATPATPPAQPPAPPSN